jgi:hypothetical protein
MWLVRAPVASPKTFSWNAYLARNSSAPFFCIDPNGLAFVKLAFENIETQRIENLFLNHAFEQSRPIQFSVRQKEGFSLLPEISSDSIFGAHFRI